ncbi:YebC/PmpR family DNA-binding transcriptional regulator [Miniphocaeibacter halophilus]|uniref:YebC/PmpR family DNA-binding transcriptional regulator n=1 Tax=Miniphocaeibacter halophilus TaxID=2931922 RepID=A0AC61MPV2_9FIRM|nr:YebC/PmpR family DNA-binding transcriptional regulator [Miniphocaeibacter halophilus]QQK07502.1 YebC/PmpR family DNA-binding transcriptional regulator [Miniphocaeibacter halophilus]
MAGHNKWSKIKNKKGSEDARRGKVFTKLAREIIVAVKEGGSDPEYNASLKTAIEKAKAENMPNDNIDRAIKKGSGSNEQDNYEEVVYEGYGPAGVAVIVSCLTDNRNRTAPEVRHAFDKYGGNLGQTGSVMFTFERKGLLIMDQGDYDEEEVMMTAIDAGAEDFSSEDGQFEIITEMTDFSTVRDILLKEGYKFTTAELVYLPNNEIDVSNEEDIKNLVKLIDILEDNDDVQNVYHNWNIPDDLEA